MPQVTMSPTPRWAQVQADPALGRSLVTAVDTRVMESYQRMTQWNLIDNVSDNFWLYMYGRRENGTRYRFRMNRIQLTCIANAAIQVGDRPEVKFTPRESGEKPVCFINTNAQTPPAAQIPESMVGRLYAQLRPETYQAGEQGYPEPLNDMEAALVQQMSQQSDAMRLQAVATGTPPPLDILPENFLIEVNDYEVSQAAQTIFDIKAEQANFSRAVVENVLYNNIFGYQFLLVEFDDEKKRFVFRNPEFLTVHVDPFRTDIRDCQYAIFDEFLGAEEAGALYPELSEAIERNAMQGPPMFPGYTPARQPLPWFQALMGRRVVIVRTCWLRNEPFPLSEEDALATGKVVKAPFQKPPGEMGQPDRNDPGFFDKILGAAKKFFGGKGNAQPQDVSGNVGGTSPENDELSANTDPSRQTDDESPGGLPGQLEEGGTQGVDDAVPLAGGEAGIDPDTGAGDGAGPALPLLFFVVGKDGQPDYEIGPIDETHVRWPCRRGLREIRIIASEMVQDRESERLDIPLGHNVNIPICFTPFGQGEPERLEPLQRAYNATLTDIVEHGDSVAFAPKLTLQSIAKANPELMRDGFVNPRKITPVDDKTAVAIGGLKNAMVSVEPPALPADTWKREQVLSDRFDMESDQSSILRGDTPNESQMSGTAIANLQSAAKTSITFKAGRTEDMLKYVVRIMLSDIVLRITPEELAQDVRKYPIQVWYEIHRRLAYQCLECDIAIQLTTAQAGTANRLNGMLAAKGQGIMVSDNTIMEAMKLDPDVEMNNNLKAQQKMQMAQAQAGPSCPQGAAGQEDQGSRNHTRPAA